MTDWTIFLRYIYSQGATLSEYGHLKRTWTANASCLLEFAQYQGDNNIFIPFIIMYIHL